VGFQTIGLTGGIGAGKSTVASMFAELGVPIVDADRVAREVVEPGTDGLREVVAQFGEGVLDANGALDRGKLGETVFADESKRRTLNAILHPRIAIASMQRLNEHQQAGHRYAIYEAALLVENGTYRMFGGLIVVAAHETNQLARVAKRDALDDDAIRARIASQLPLEQKIAVADWVIWNDGTLEDLRARVVQVHGEILVRLGVSR
jgi:dephospho-CoA kinase